MLALTTSGNFAHRTGPQQAELHFPRSTLAVWDLHDSSQLQAQHGAVADALAARLSNAVPGGVPHALRLGAFLRLAITAPERRSASEECEGFRLSVSRISGTANDSHVLHIVLQLPRERLGRDHDACWQTLQVKVRGKEIPEESSPDLAEFDLRGLDLALNWPRANLRGARLAHADLENAKLGGADFTGANLDNAQFKSCQLTGCDFSGAWMAGARLTGCDLLGANFTGSSLEQATLKGCWMSPATKLPAGMAVPRNLRRAADVLKGPGDVVVISERAPAFVVEFARMMEGCNVSVFRAMARTGLDPNQCCDVQWPRDYWFKCGAATPQESFRLLAVPRDKSMLVKGGGNMYAHRHHSFHAAAEEITDAEFEMEGWAHHLDHLSATLGGSKVMLGIGAPGAIEQAQKRYVPSGNLIMLDEEHFRGGLCIVGTDSIAYRIDVNEQRQVPRDLQDKVAASYPKVLSPQRRDALWFARRDAKTELRTLLGVRKTVFVPQVFRHIDMLAMYFGRNLLGLHSFEKAVSFLETNEDAMVGEIGATEFQQLLGSTRALSEKFGGHINAFAGRLRKEGVEVIEMCAVLVSGIKKGLPEKLYSMFPNGVAFDPGGDSRLSFYTTSAPQARTHQGHFWEICRQHRIDVNFVSGGEDPVQWIKQQGGGLRCSTAFNLVGELNHPTHG